MPSATPPRIRMYRLVYQQSELRPRQRLSRSPAQIPHRSDRAAARRCRRSRWPSSRVAAESQRVRERSVVTVGNWPTA
jgi:hypothetical protein